MRGLAYRLMLLLLFTGTLYAQDSNPPKGRFSGLMFGDYYYNIQRDGNFSSIPNAASASAAPGLTAMQAFQFRRIYFMYEYDISEKFTTRFRLEADQGTDVLASGKISDFVKDAYIKWKNVFTGSDLIFGIQPPPAYEISEAAWGYRSLEKTIMDVRGIVSSRDQGLSLKGKLTDDGMFNYWVMFANNSGNSPATTKYKRYYAHIHVKPMTNLQITLYGDYKAQPEIADPYHAGGSLSNSVITTALFAGYNDPGNFSLGAEGFLQSTQNGFNNGTSVASKSAIGLSFWATYNFQSDLAIVGRYDNYDPNTDGSVSGDVRNYIIGGLDWKVDKNVSIEPNVLYESYQAPSGGTAPDASVTGRLTFYYVFLPN